MRLAIVSHVDGGLGHFLQENCSISLKVRMLSTRFLSRIVGFLLCLLPILALAGAGDFTNGEDDFLSPDVAFKLDLTVLGSQKIAANFKVVDGYYLYKERISFKDATGKVITANLPAGDIKEDPNFGTQEVYHHDFKAEIDVAGLQNPVELPRAIKVVARKVCATRRLPKK
jgi:thiol:disulfide interchange protein